MKSNTPLQELLSPLPAAQQPELPDSSILAEVLAELANYPPLVRPADCDQLRAQLAAAADGEAFILQGGDCAETFDSVSAPSVARKLAVLHQMARILSGATSIPTVTIGRAAGQYSKPRSRPEEAKGTTALPVYRGDAVNDRSFTEQARTPDPRRLLGAYHSSAATLNLIQAHIAGDPAAASPLYVSHEALLLDYETALTRTDPRTNSLYGTSGHLLWIGERTRHLHGAHIEFASRIRNPIGVKLGPGATADDALALIAKLDPDGEPGRPTFITRMGCGRVRHLLPGIAAKVRASGSQVTWLCDPMHGNTFTLPDGRKTRRLGDILDEIRGFLQVHQQLGTTRGGLHLELTGDEVTECLGDGQPVSSPGLDRRYETACDPRLNSSQALQLARATSGLLTRPATGRSL